MTKNFSLLLALLIGLVVGAVAVFYRTSSVQRRASDGDFAIVKKKEADLSPVLFWDEYVKAKRSVELRFEKQVPVIDGEVFAGDNLESALLKKKDQKKAEYLVIVGDDFDRFGALVERVDSFRKLGFGTVVLMTNHVWVYDESAHNWARSR